MTERRLLLVNGPNLNLLGTRQPEVYGTTTLAQIEARVAEVAAQAGLQVRTVQSNHEGVLVDAIHAAAGDCGAIVINPAAYSHTSVAIADALRSVEDKISDGRKKLDELKESGEENVDSLRKQLSDLIGPDDKR